MQEKLRKYQEILNLANWDIQLIEEETLNSDAATKMVYNDYKAIIKLRKELSDDEKEKSLIHELLHLVHRDELDIIDDNIEDDKIRELYDRFHERAIEQMARVIYKLTR